MIKSPQEGEKIERAFICVFDCFLVHRNDIVEFRRPMTYADEPTQIGRVCSLVKDVAVLWPEVSDRSALLVSGFDGKYAVIHSDGMVRNFGADYVDGYDGCLSSEELVEFGKWAWCWPKAKEKKRG